MKNNMQWIPCAQIQLHALVAVNHSISKHMHARTHARTHTSKYYVASTIALLKEDNL